MAYRAFLVSHLLAIICVGSAIKDDDRVTNKLIRSETILQSSQPNVQSDTLSHPSSPEALPTSAHEEQHGDATMSNVAHDAHEAHEAHEAQQAHERHEDEVVFPDEASAAGYKVGQANMTEESHKSLTAQDEGQQANMVGSSSSTGRFTSVATSIGLGNHSYGYRLAKQVEYELNMDALDIQTKSKVVLALLNLALICPFPAPCLPCWGCAVRWYLGQQSLACLKLLTCNGCFLWGMVDFLVITINMFLMVGSIKIPELALFVSFETGTIGPAYWYTVYGLGALCIIYCCGGPAGIAAWCRSSGPPESADDKGEAEAAPAPAESAPPADDAS